MGDWQVLTGSAVGMTVTVSVPDVSTLGTAGNLRLAGWNGLFKKYQISSYLYHLG